MTRERVEVSIKLEPLELSRFLRLFSTSEAVICAEERLPLLKKEWCGAAEDGTLSLEARVKSLLLDDTFTKLSREPDWEGVTPNASIETVHKDDVLRLGTRTELLLEVDCQKIQDLGFGPRERIQKQCGLVPL
ncbi:hypothetical protein J6590_081135 [Homalodisca vitripennis]|nr:hypothetical protein J6590_081135 [Homalodisca vitripennis]